MRRTRPADSLWAGPWTALAGIMVGLGALWTHEGRRNLYEESSAQVAHDLANGSVSEGPQAEWFRRQVLALTEPIPTVLQLDTSGFPGIVIEGESELQGDEQRIRATRAELARWSAGGELPIVTQRLAADSPDQAAWSRLTVEAEGAEAEALATLQHLLASPGLESGYLTDPARVVVEVAGRGRLRFELQLRVWPVDAFVTEQGEGS